MRRTIHLAIAVLLMSGPFAWSQSGSLFDPENARVQEKPKRKLPNAPATKAVEGSVPFPITKEAGPILVKVASFVGEEDLRYAIALATELREQYQMPAYIHEFQAKIEGMMTDEQAAAFEKQFKIKPRRHVPLTTPPLNYVVMVGDFPSMEDPLAQKTLQRLRKIRIDSVPANIWEKYRISALGSVKEAAKKNSPLASAMLVANPHPQAPKFQKELSPEAMALVLDLNTNTPFSVYENPHPYTLAVAQFTGTQVFGNNDKNKGIAEKIFGGNKSPLSQAAQQAISLTDALRKLGWDAYVFHGQYASIVCVGGFPEKADLSDPQMRDLRYRVTFMDQHPDVVSYRKRLAEIKLGDKAGNFTLSANAEIMLTPRPPKLPGAAPLAQ